MKPAPAKLPVEPPEHKIADRIHGILWLTVALVFVSIIMAAVSPNAGGGPPPLVSTELAHSWFEVESAAQFALDNNQTGAMRATLACDFLFLFAYAALFYWTTRLAADKFPALARVTAVLAMATAAFDCMENIGALAILAQLPGHVTGWGKDIAAVKVGEGSTLILTLTRIASSGKWILIGCTAILTGVLWIKSIRSLADRRWAGWLTAAAYIAGGALCIAGLVSHPLFEMGLILIGAAFLIQLGALSQIMNALRLAYVTRTPFLTLTLTAALGPLALGPASALLGGLFNFENDARGLTLLALVAGLVGCAAVTQVNVTMYYGRLRLGDPGFDFLDPLAHSALTLATGVAPAALLIGCAASISEDISVPAKIGASVAGLLGAGVFALFAKMIQLTFTDKATTIPPPPYLLFAPRAGSWFAEFLQAKYDLPPPAFIEYIKSLRHKIGSGWIWFGEGPGYFAGHPRRLLSGHSFSLALAAFSVLVYLGIGFGKRYINIGGEQKVPSLVFVLLAVLAASWLLAALAFLLDRFRFPLLLAIAALTLITGLTSKRDHVFTVFPGSTVASLKTPADVLNTVRSRQVIPVAIAAAGGGIQATAWTARVLEGLHQRDPKFGSRVALVSSISGGSVGALFYGAKLRKSDLTKLYEDASKASIDEVAWGLVMPDVGRLVLPFWAWPEIDRGWALERTWIDRIHPGNLSDWSKDTAEGKLPAFLINSTATEKGQLISFATTQFPSASYKGKKVTVRYNELLNDFDLSVATAARMSATFPYVTPAARPSGEGVNGYHLVDGGYYDNYGLIGLSQWVDDALENMKEEQRPPKLAVVTIRSFPDDPDPAPAGWGWLRQITAPLGAFLNVRSYAQWQGANEQLRLLREKWAGRKVEIVPFDIQYPASIARRLGEPPLSWKLTKRQSDAVQAAWSDQNIQAEIGRLLESIEAQRP